MRSGGNREWGVGNRALRPAIPRLFLKTALRQR